MVGRRVVLIRMLCAVSSCSRFRKLESLERYLVVLLGFGSSQGTTGSC